MSDHIAEEKTETEAQVRSIDEKKEENPDLEYLEKKCLCCKRKVLKDTVPASRVWKLQKQEAAFLALGLFAAALSGCMMPAFGLVFTEVRCCPASEVRSLTECSVC